MSKKKIYIAGKVTGEPQEACTEKFAIMKQAIEALGFEAINPIEVVGDWQTSWNKAMRMCVAKLTECDGVVLLPCWTASKGAKMEWEVSKMLGIPDFRGTQYGLQNLKEHKWSN